MWDELVGPFGAFALDEEVTQAAQDLGQSRHRVGRFRELDGQGAVILGEVQGSIGNAFDGRRHGTEEADMAQVVLARNRVAW